MVGSSANIACPNFIINTIVAEELSKFADELEKANDFNNALNSLIKSTIKKHKRILFSGNNYSKEWEKEAAKRGLLNLKTTVDALPKYVDEKNIALFKKHRVLSENEIRSRMEILLENYANIVHIEALTSLDIARKQIAPSVIAYESFLLKEIKLKREYSTKLHRSMEEGILNRISDLSEKFWAALEKLSVDTEKYDGGASNLKKAEYCKNVLLEDMKKLREYADGMELIIGKDFASFPTYEDILYSVKY